MCAAVVPPRPWKRSRSETELDRSTANEQKRRRDSALNTSSRSAEDVRQVVSIDTPQPGPSTSEVDARDLLQLTLDRICEMQRKLMQRGGTCSEGGALQDCPDESTDESDEDDDDEGSEAIDSSFQEQEVVLAGYEYCQKEALRFLVEEEHLGPDHPAVRELTAHLSARRNAVDSAQVLANYLLITSSAESINV